MEGEQEANDQKNTLVTLKGQDIVVLPVALNNNNDQLKKKSTKISPTKIDQSDLNSLENGKKTLEEDEASRQKLDDKEENETRFSRCIGNVHGAIGNFFEKNSSNINSLFTGIAVLGFIIYFFSAIYFNKEGLGPLIGITVLVASVIFLINFSRKCGDRIDRCLCVHLRKLNNSRGCKFFKWFLYILVLLCLVAFVLFDVGFDRLRLSSLGGMFFFIVGGFLTSKYPNKIKWRPVLWGLGLQLTLAVLILRWKPGFYFFQFVGDKTKTFLNFADSGSEFVFGESGLIDHPMAFQVFPIIIYFSAVVNIFYYWGLMQFVVCKIAWLMQFTMGTTAIESLNAACNIFIGMAESCVIMRPFLGRLTKSELHAVMTGGFATVAGSYIALLVSFGASPQHLISAAIMSAPAALAMAKLNYPETEESHTKTEGDVQLEKAPEKNLIQAASNGAMSALSVVASVAANLIAILGLISFVDSILGYLGSLVGMPKLSFKSITGYCFWPLALIMGVEVEDSTKVGSLLGTKVFVDEFVSFQHLVRMVNHTEISTRSEVLATYACCGFGSIAAMGVYIGALTTVAPSRKEDISQVAFRAMLNGNVAGFLTACIAGVLYNGDSFNTFTMNLGGHNNSLIDS